MGDLANKYIEIVQQHKDIRDLPGPDPATARKEYADFRKKVRMADRKAKHAMECIKRLPVSSDVAISIYAQVAGEERKNDEVADLENVNGHFWSMYVTDLEKQHPELTGGLTGEKRHQYLVSMTVKVQQIKDWIKEGKISEAEFDAQKTAYFTRITKGLSTEKQKQYLEAIEGQISEEQKQAVLNAIDSYRDVTEYTEDEIYTHPYKDTIDELKAFMPKEIADDPVKKQEYEDILDFANAHLTDMDGDVRAEIKEQESDGQKIEAKVADHVNETIIPEYKNGKYHQMHKKVEGLYTGYVTKEGREKELEDLLEEKPTVSEKTQEGIRKVLRKMEEMGLENYSSDKSGEDGNKIYGFNKLCHDKSALLRALGAGDANEIIRCGKAYKKTVEDMNELYSLAKEYFNADPLLHTGNLDSIRNEFIPGEFSSDIHTTAQINTMFLNYMYIKEQGLSIDDYAKDPINSAFKGALQKMIPQSFAERSKGCSLEESLDLLSSQGRFAGADEKVTSAVPGKGFGRILDTGFLLDADREKAKETAVVSQAFQNLFERVIVHSDKSKFSLFDVGCRDEEIRKCRIGTLQNLMLAKDEERNINALIAGMPATDITGKVIGKGFDTGAAIMAKPADYDGIVERAGILLKKAREMRRYSNATQKVRVDDILEATADLYAKVLSANAADKDSYGYKKMERAMKLLYPQITKEAEPEQRERIKAFTDSVIPAEKKEKPKAKAWEDPDFALGYKFSAIPQNAYKMAGSPAKANEYMQESIGILGEAFQSPERHAAIVRLKGMYNFDPKMQLVHGDNQLVMISNPIVDEPLADRAGEMFKKLVTDLKQAAGEVTEPGAKRFFDDMIYLASMDPVRLASIHAEDPCSKNLSHLIAMTVNLEVPGYTKEQIRKELGSVYDDHLDLVHYGIEEMRLQSERRDTEAELKRQGRTWGEDEEAEYTGKIKENHAKLINAYDRLSDTYLPKDKEQKFMGNPLAQSLGTAQETNRDIFRHIGYLRGEMRALENGWNSKDMCIPGFMAAVDAQISKYRKYGTAEEKEGIDEAEKDLRVIMNRFYDKKVETNADKKEVCDALRAFADKHGQKKVLAMINENITTFERTCDEIDRAYLKTAQKDAEYSYVREKNPTAFLKALEKNAVENGDYKMFAEELVKLAAKEEQLTAGAAKKFNDYLDELMAVDSNGNFKKGAEFYEKLCDEINRQHYNNTIEFAKESEKRAKAIRNGMALTDEAYEGIKTDYETSRYIADSQLENSFLKKKQDGSGMLRERMRMASPLNSEDRLVFSVREEKIKNECIKAGRYDDNAADRSRLLEEGLARYEYGKEKGADPAQMDDAQRRAYFDQAYDKAASFYNNMEMIKGSAAEKLDALTTLKDGRTGNSKEFMAMYEALEKVCGLGMDATPSAIINAYGELGKAAEQYKQKIDGQTFANKKPNGQQRYAMAGELISMCAENTKKLTELSKKAVSPYEALCDQIMKAQKNAGMADSEQEKKEEKKERRKLDKKEVKNMIEGDKKQKQVRSNSTGPQGVAKELKSGQKQLKNNKS